MQVLVDNTPKKKLAYTNRVFLSDGDFADLRTSTSFPVSPTDPVLNVTIGGLIFLAAPHKDMEAGKIGMNELQRRLCSYTLNKQIDLTLFYPGEEEALAGMTVGVDMLAKKTPDGSPITFDCKELEESWKTQFQFMVMNAGQNLAMDFGGVKLSMTIEGMDHAFDTKSDQRGQLLGTTNIHFKKSNGCTTPIKFEGGAASGRNESLFKGDFNFEKMGVGGLGDQFQTIFRRAFAPRIFPGLVKSLGINFVRGMLLYGPPGCGKTLIARQIGKVLNAREPKIINGPEVLNKYVGGSEEKIRELFADAEAEQAEMGDASMLHIIIFDEMDAVMKQRGSSSDSSGVSDSIVNQLLSKIDGVDSLNNILIIGMTNRKDMIDDAILRPGRLEMHVEIGLPDDAGRLQIINIHTTKMRDNGRITDDAAGKLGLLAASTKNYTGAEIEGLVRSATSFAIGRNVDLDNLGDVDEDAIKVEWQDFERAIEETTAQFGAKDSEALEIHCRTPLIDYGSSYSDIWGSVQRLLKQVKTSQHTPLMTVLLEGEKSTGKTAIAARLAKESGLSFIRMISAEELIGKSDRQRVDTLQKTFVDAYKSDTSLIFLDDIERLIDYSVGGFSNPLLQTLLILLNKVPPVAGRRLLVVGTTAMASRLEDLGLPQAFKVNLHVNRLQSADEVRHTLISRGLSEDEAVAISDSLDVLENPIGIKQLLMVLEMARSTCEEDTMSVAHFMECMHTCGY